MKTPLLLTAALATSLGLVHTVGQSFDAGSNGTRGHVVIDQDTTINLPEDGKLHFKSLTVNADKRLRFNRNTNNTPVYILSQGDVIINGAVDVNGFNSPTDTPIGGKGGPGGFDGGKPGFGAEVPPASGYGPGAGRGGIDVCDSNRADNVGSGSYGSQVSGNPQFGPTYGSPLLIPLLGGSGGGGTAGQPGRGGHGGGGAILIAANTRIVIAGIVEALGGGPGPCFTGGSGGGIRLVAPKVEGTGRIDVRGPQNAGHGRIRVDTIDRTNLRFVFDANGVTTVGANMFVFPSVVPTLDVTQAAGQNIPLGSGPVQITLPFGSDPNRTVTVRAQGFGAKVPIAVVLTPDSGVRQIIEKEIDNLAQNPATLAVPVTLTPNVLTTIHVWTR
jgi:hypothetical protein